MKIHFVAFAHKHLSSINLNNLKSSSDAQLASIKVHIYFINFMPKMLLNVFIHLLAHPSCISMSRRMHLRTLAYKWQCSNCKTCCKCRKVKDNKMLFCVQCDRGFHIYCLGLRNVPEGKSEHTEISF